MITVRPATRDDAAALQSIYAHCIAHADWLPEAARQSPSFAAVSVGETVHVAATAAGEVIGFVSVQVNDPFVHHLYVHPDARGHGAGRRLLASLEGWLPRPWRLKCVRRNVDALAFYRRLGWREIGSGESEHGAFAVLAYGPGAPPSPESTSYLTRQNQGPQRMPFVPPTFSAPRQWRHPLFQLQVLSPIHAEPDFEAVMASADDIRHVFGQDNDWPDAQMSFEENRGDLERHEAEFEQDVAFAYAMLDPDGGRYLGCVYIRPIKSRIEGDLRKQRYPAQAHFWLSSLHGQITAQQTLEALKTWLAECWPFERVAFPGREIDWPSWEAMAHGAALAEPANTPR